MQNNTDQINEYIRAVTIRAMRFLPSLDAHDWETLIEFATTSESVVERLMATETWLYLSPPVDSPLIKARHIEAVKMALNTVPPPTTRLKANYILILGLYAPDAICEGPENDDDYLFREARKMAIEGSVKDLFDSPEPKIIREKYYSGKSKAGMGEEEDY
ncbi:MAG: hypothetical protein KME26_21830 [Oscillatoria princeps RMCB-10]|jgi:hypothetical protein|nr:hypothetical protein [Oscillatoria princeps RMCB-10]